MPNLSARAAPDGIGLQLLDLRGIANVRRLTKQAQKPMLRIRVPSGRAESASAH